MALCTNLQNRVLDLEKTKITQKKEIASQQDEIASLKRRVKKLENRNRLRTHKLKRLYKVGLMARIESSDNEESLGEDASKQERRIDAIDVDEDITLVSVQGDVDKEMFDVDILGGEEMFVARQNENIVEEVVDAAQVSSASTTVTITTKEITLAQALKVLKTSKPKIDVDHHLAERMQAQEQEELSDAEKATLFQQLLEKRRNHFAAKSREEKRNKPPTKAQKRNIMCTYLKNMEEYKIKDLKLKEFDFVQEMFDKAFKKLMETITNEEEEVAIDVVPLAVKSGRIVEIKSLFDAVGITAAQVYVNTTLMKNDASVASTAEADPENSAPSDFVPQQQVHELEIKLPEDLKEIPTKLEDFTKPATSLTSQFAELKTLQWELPVEFLSLPVQVASIEAKLKTLDALPSLLLNVTKALNKFAQVLDSAL
nr:hypothetical protein [Tanacetum cinerariifolium]